MRNKTRGLAWQRFILQVPWLNRWQQIGFLTQWTKVLATTIQAGLPLLECLKLSERSTHNEALQQQLKKITANVAAGDNLANAITKHTIFPQQVHSLIQIGEQSGNLHTTLNHLAKQYQQKLNQKISSFTKLLEPAIMLILAIIIGTIVIALYLPVFQLGNAL